MDVTWAKTAKQLSTDVIIDFNKSNIPDVSDYMHGKSMNDYPIYATAVQSRISLSYTVDH